jgi:hypothetical protein
LSFVKASPELPPCAEAGAEAEAELAGDAEPPPPPLWADPPPELPAWAQAALEESGFVGRFQRAKEGEEAAFRLHREEVEAFERAAKELRARNAPEGEVLAARRDLVCAKARATAAALLWVEILRGRVVAGLDPVEIVAGVVEAQRELFSGEASAQADEGSLTDATSEAS